MVADVRCEWREDEDGGYYTDCGECFTPLNVGAGALDWVRYCCWCGKPVRTVDYNPDDGEE
jgi:hypothetical protein